MHLAPLGDTPVRGVAAWCHAATSRTGVPTERSLAFLLDVSFSILY